jgi:transcriptional regulator with XRE-family HTH domain
MPANLDGNFAERLAILMRDQQLGLLRLSRFTGIDQKSITRYRNGTVEPRDAFGQPTANAWKLARTLGVEVDELLPPREKTAA